MFKDWFIMKINFLLLPFTFFDQPIRMKKKLSKLLLRNTNGNTPYLVEFEEVGGGCVEDVTTSGVGDRVS